MNSRGELESSCREDPDLDWPEFKDAYTGPDHQKVWQTECKIMYAGETLRAIVKAISKKKARAGAAEAVFRLYVAKREAKLAAGIIQPFQKKAMDKKERKRKFDPNYVRPTHIFVLVPPLSETDSALALDFATQSKTLLTSDKWKLVSPLMEVHSFGVESAAEMEPAETPPEPTAPSVQSESTALDATDSEDVMPLTKTHCTKIAGFDAQYVNLLFFLAKGSGQFKRHEKQVFLVTADSKVETTRMFMEEEGCHISTIKTIDDLDDLMEQWLAEKVAVEDSADQEAKRRC